jgi:xanthine dehydrogenase accessory factor
MTSTLDALCQRLAHEAAMLVHVHRTEGSAPREAGTWMAVFAGGVVGTIGGGQLEWQAIAEARRRLAGAAGSGQAPVRYPLGPSLGQCCGGVVWLRFERVDATDIDTVATRLAPQLTPLALFGGGHVGQALVRVLSMLPYAITWIDSRDGIFPLDVPATVRCEHSDPVHAAVHDLPPGTQVLVMSFSHAEDLDIVAACLRRLREQDDLPFIGLIGSKTKWAAFRHRLAQRGFSESEMDRITCPIGIPGIRGKEPEVIAVAVAAQLLGTRR